MSGIDEQNRDVPECPTCGKKPDYWTVESGGKPTIWFYSEAHRSDESYNGLPTPYNNYMGEGHYKVLSSGKPIFNRATCMGERGCGKVAFLTDHKELFERFYNMYVEFFPHKIYRTDC